MSNILKYHLDIFSCDSGKMFKSRDLPVVVEFFLMFYRDKPIDWLLDYFLTVKVCNPEKDHVSLTRDSDSNIFIPLCVGFAYFGFNLKSEFRNTAAG